ncbi:MAG TPA: hypothetical protein VJX67_06345 [Blastocatellia bacterium]|nr:hypothetical protein [Blastocatellia bacterium]
MDWITGDVFGVPVEKKEIRRAGGKPYIANTANGTGVLHTTEGGSVAGAWNTLSKSGSAPHVICGEGRIVQCRPLNVQGAALRGGPNNANKGPIQIEMVGFSKEVLWLPEKGTLTPAVAFMAYCAAELGIPLSVPYDWADDLSDCSKPWASHNSRRRKMEGDWPNIPKGWYMHLEQGWQGPSWHWDAGAIQRSVMIQQAAALIAARQAAGG